MVFNPHLDASMAGRVAVIDDEIDVRDTIALALESEAMSCSRFESAEAFLECQSIREFSCVLADIRLPGMSGLDLLPILESRGIDALPIVMSGQASVAEVVRAFANRTCAFFEKPLPIQQIVATVKRLVARCNVQRRKRAGADRLLARLTPREREVMQLLVAGDKTVQIAHKLHISPSTVEKHRLRIFDKTETSSVVELIHSLPGVVSSELAVETAIAT